MTRFLQWYEQRRVSLPRFIALAPVCAAGARGLVESQHSLDDAFQEAADRWDDTGIPPVGWIWSRSRMHLGVACTPARKTLAEGRTRLGIVPQMQAAGGLMVSIEYRQHDGEPEE